MTLKCNQGHWKWYEWVQLNEHYHHTKFDIYLIYTVQENRNVKVSTIYRLSACLPDIDHHIKSHFSCELKKKKYIYTYKSPYPNEVTTPRREQNYAVLPWHYHVLVIQNHHSSRSKMRTDPGRNSGTGTYKLILLSRKVHCYLLLDPKLYRDTIHRLLN